MNKPTFLNHDHPLLTVMVQAQTPDRVLELVNKSYPLGAEAFGMQLCKLPPEHRNEETCRKLFSSTYGLPVYVTNYRSAQNEGKSDDQLARELITYAKYGATLCDVMGDYFCKAEDEFTHDPEAVKKQVELIAALHDAGAEVLMSSHTHAKTPADRVLEIALGQQERGADICKIVTKADTPEEEVENLRIITLLKKELKIPFLYLCGGASSHLLRRVGETLGNCTTLCVYEYDELATKVQPLLSDMRTLRGLI